MLFFDESILKDTLFSSYLIIIVSAMTNLRLNHLSDQLIHDELCRRLRMARLKVDITQAELAEKSGVSLITVKRAESGKGNITLMTLIALLRGIDALEQLDNFLPEPSLSPLQLKASTGKQRQRASSKRTESEPPAAGWKWGDES